MVKFVDKNLTNKMGNYVFNHEIKHLSNNLTSHIPKHLEKYLSKQTGVALLMFVILLPLILGFCGIAIDGGLLLYNYSKMRNSIRYAAYSGGSQSFPDEDGIYQITDINKAEEVAENNFEVNFGEETDANFSADANSDSIEVSASIEVQLYFIPILGAPSSITLSDYYIVLVN